MTRERNKPTQSWIERTKIEIEHEEELTIERAYELGKIRGKKEQEAIDDDLFREVKKMVIDKACEWIESHFRDIENPDFSSKRNHPTEVESMYHWSVKELVDDFRKAMEEE